MSVNPKEVGVNTDIVQAEEAVRWNSQTEHTAKLVKAGIQAEKNKLETADNKNGPPAQGSPEGKVYCDVAFEAIGGGTLIKTAQTISDIVADRDPGKFGGMKTMEDLIHGVSPKTASAPVAKDIMGDKIRSIRTGYFNDMAGRSQNVSDFMSREDNKVKGVKADETSIAALTTTKELLLTAQVLSKLHLGNAINEKAKISAKMGQAQQKGMAPGGNITTANLNKALQYRHNGPENGPTAPIFQETESVT